MFFMRQFVPLKLFLNVSCYYQDPGTSTTFQLYWQLRLQSCYYINYAASVTYYQARSQCLDIDGNLTSVFDQDERDFLHGELNIMNQWLSGCCLRLKIIAVMSSYEYFFFSFFAKKL